MTTTDQPTPEADEQEPAAAADERSDSEHDDDHDDESPRDRRYRQQLRQVERERDRLREALVPRLRAEVERVAGQKLTAGSSIWLVPGLDPMQLVDDGLAVDAKKVTAAVERLLEHAPQLGQVVPDFDAGARSSPAETRAASWQATLRGR